MGSAYDPKPFTQWIMRMRANMSKTIEKPLEMVTRVTAEYGIPEYSGVILTRLIDSDEMTKWTLAVAVATIAKLELPDERFRLERIAGRIASEPLRTTQTNLEEQ